MPSGVFSLKQLYQALQQGSWVNQKPLNVDYLVVAGGGGAGASDPGGGGAGGVALGNTSVTPGSAITVTVGAGGGGTSGGSAPGNGSNSVFGPITAVGGGKGENAGVAANSGGSGGGTGGSRLANGQGTINQGNPGGSAYASPGGSSGGGGAGSVGASITVYNAGGSGGNGIGSSLGGTLSGYGGGGAGSTGNTGSGTSSPPTAYGGGGTPAAPNGGSGTANTGGGGSGAPNYTGGGGGSGIVILSYPDIYQAAASTTGSPTVSTSGSGSMSFNGSNQYLLYNAQSAFAFGTGDFTIEFFVRFVDTNAGFPIDFRPSGGSSDAPVIYISVNTLRYYVSVDRITSGTLTAGVWYHVAVARSGTSTKMFIDGSQVGSTFTDTTNYTVGSGRPAIGSNGATLVSSLLNGYLSNFRIVKGTALYTSNFTPPTSPLTAVSNTSFLLNTVSGAVTADASGNGIAPGSGSQTVGWNQLSPFATGLGYKNRVYTWTSSGSITF